MKLKFVEIGKVMLVWGILKNVTQVVQRVVFLHEDLVKLPSFPRKALEAELELFKDGHIGKVDNKQAFQEVEIFKIFFLANYKTLMFHQQITFSPFLKAVKDNNKL